MIGVYVAVYLILLAILAYTVEELPQTSPAATAIVAISLFLLVGGCIFLGFLLNSASSGASFFILGILALGAGVDKSKAHTKEKTKN